MPSPQLSPITPLCKFTCIHSLITTCTQMTYPIYTSSSDLSCNLHTGISRCLPYLSSRMSQSPLELSLLPKADPLPLFPVSMDCPIQLYLGIFWYLPVLPTIFETCFSSFVLCVCHILPILFVNNFQNLPIFYLHDHHPAIFSFLSTTAITPNLPTFTLLPSSLFSWSQPEWSLHKADHSVLRLKSSWLPITLKPQPL